MPQRRLRQINMRVLQMALFIVTCLAVGLPTQVSASPPDSKTKKPANVDENRVQTDSELGRNWMVYGRDFNAQHYSPLDSVSTKNVKDLGLAWAADIDSSFGLVAEPIVVDGVIYLSGMMSRVYAIDARAGTLLWQFNPKIDLSTNRGVSYSSRVNRGVAVWEGRVYVGTADCRLIAVDAKTGAKDWEAEVCDWRDGGGGGITGAPRAGDGKIFMGHFGSELGKRGSIAAFDAKDGKELWRFWTVPADPAKGPFESPALEMASKTWTKGFSEYGGGVVYDAITYDSVTGLVYFGTGSAIPMNARLRDPKGLDNLFTNSIVAVRADTGEYVWHYQTVPFDAWDYDATWHLMVAEVPDGTGGESTRRVVMQAPKNGFFYVLDAKSGQLLSADPIARVTWASHIDLETGRPVENPEARYHDSEPGGAKVLVAPSVTGAHSWPAMSLSTETGFLYLPVSDLPGFYSTGSDGKGWYECEGVTPDDVVPEGAVPEKPGRLLAWDPIAKKEAWSVRQAHAHNGGILSTGGGLVFQGEATGDFSAYSAATGKTLWSFETRSGIQAAPVTVVLDGEQFVLVPVGQGSFLSMACPALMTNELAQGPSRLLAFKLGAKGRLPKNEPVVMPVPPKQTASPKQVAKGAKLWKKVGCGDCHGTYAVGIGRRVLGGSLPDLRYAPQLVHDEWHAIVVGGSRREKGMLPFPVSIEESEALQAFVVEQAWKEYSARNPDGASQ
jgi:quinohemoprotein ethanol dehydrogenase